MSTALAKTSPTTLERIIAAISPSWALSRVKARMQMVRHFEAAQIGRRTSNWSRPGSDANAAVALGLAPLRFLARDLVRNNAWARNAKRVIATNTVSWGIVPKPIGRGDFKPLVAAWKSWAETAACDADGMLTLSGLQKLVMGTVVESGEALVRRRRRRVEDGLPIPLQLQVIEPDLLDQSKDATTSSAGGPIVQGVEFDKLGRRAAYWMFEQHPGSGRVTSLVSRRIPASEIIHVYDVERAGQARGPSWLASVIVNLRDFDEYEDALLVQQKIGACLAAFVHDMEGGGGDPIIGEPGKSSDGKSIETFEPGMVVTLPPGKDVKIATPPVVSNGQFSVGTLRRIAAGLGITYEELVGDYSNVNYSSGRMGWHRSWANIEDWRWNMLVPQFCNGIWGWAMEAAIGIGLVDEQPVAEWTAPPRPMLDPEKEGLAYTRRVRSGQMTFSEMIREQGRDPTVHLDEYQSDLAELDKREIWLDSDVRKVSAAGLTQERVGGGAGGKDANASEESTSK